MQINRLVIQLLVKKRSQTAHLRRKTSLRVTLLRTTLFSGCYWCDQYEKKKIKKKFGSLYQQQWALPAEPLKKWRSGRITTLTQKKKKPNMFLCTNKRIGPISASQGTPELVPLGGCLVSIIGGCLISGVAPQREADTFMRLWESV